MSKKKPTSYREASEEIDSILQEIEEEEQADVDQLADKVERASELIRFCFDRLKGAETRVARVTQELTEAAEEEEDPGE